MAKLRVDKIAAPIVKDEYTGSVYFDGSGDYLTVESSTDFAFGTGDFTVEFWMKRTNSGNNVGLLDTRTTNTDVNGWFIRFNSATTIQLVDNATQYVTLTHSSDWNHIAFVRESNIITSYINGVAGSVTTGVSVNFTSSNFLLGGFTNTQASPNAYGGYISNLRICKGHAVYTGNFTPPTRELEVHTGAKGVVFPAADNRTVLLACQDAYNPTTEATGRHKITANGNATAADANPGLLRKTNITSTITETTGSVFFDGTGDYLSISSSSDFNYEAGDFTIEGWIYMNSLPASGSRYTLASKWTGAGDYSWICNIFNDSGNMELNFGYTTDGSNATDLYSNGGPSEAEKWYHIAYVRDGGTLRQFVNGVQLSTNAISGTIHVDTQDVNIGRHGQDTNYINGYISNLRVCKGHAVYKSNFIPPSRELEVHEGPDDDRTVLLCCYDGENIFADKSGRHIIAAYGDRTSSPTPSSTDSPIGSTTVTPGLTREVDPTEGPTFGGGAGFVSQNWLTLPKGTTEQRSRGRGLVGGGYISSHTNTIEYIEIHTLGNGQDFGDLTGVKSFVAATSSSTRCLFHNGYGGSSLATIDYVNISTTGNAASFANSNTYQQSRGACGNNTRGIVAAGSASNLIEYVTFSTLGEANDFGDYGIGQYRDLSGCSSPTRGIFAGGFNPTNTNSIQYVTISTIGNSQDFGDLSSARGLGTGAASSATRGVFFGGSVYPSTSGTNIIEYVTISTFGNTTDFGDLTRSTYRAPCTSNGTRAVVYSSSPSPNSNAIEYVTIASTGDATDFGDSFVSAREYSDSASSDSHGGLS